MIQRTFFGWRSIGVQGGVLLGCVFVGLVARAEDPGDPSLRATELLPDTVVAYAELAHLGDGIDMLLEHPLRQSIEAAPAYKAIRQSEGFGRWEQGVTAFEGAMGMPWNDALATLSDGGISIALDATEGGIVLLAKSSSEEKLDRFRGFLTVIRQLQDGQPNRGGSYRGFTAMPLGKDLKLAQLDDWLLITNNSNLGKAIIDRYVDRPETSLQTSARFQSAWSTLQSPVAGQTRLAGYIDITAIRERGAAKTLFKEKTDNPLEELLLGGLFSNLQQTPYAIGKLELHSAGLKLLLATPHQQDWEPPREYFFGGPEPLAAPPLLDVEDRMFAIATHRDLSQMWLRAGDLMTDKANDRLAQADTQLTTFFSGRDFGEDILGSLEGDLQIVGKAQSFENVLPRPAIKLPAVALQFRMKNPAETQPELRRIFQSFIGFLNVVGAMEGQPQFDLDSQSLGDARLYTATYVPDRDLRDSINAPINFNFSPTIAFLDNRIIISSATSLARDLVTASPVDVVPTATSDQPTTQSYNTALTLDAKVLQSVLQTNRDQLIANSMLEKGLSQSAAAAETDGLLELLGYLRSLRIELATTDGQMQLRGELNLNTQPTE